MSESGVSAGAHQDQEYDDWDDDDWEAEQEYETGSRARVYSIVALVCAALTIWFLFRNVFLSPVFGFAGAFCSWRGIVNGGYKPVLIVLLLICLIPACLAGIALLTLIPNLPDLSFSNVRWINDN